MFICMYRDIVACGKKPVADEVKAGHSGAEVNPVGLREKINSGEQLISDAVTGVLEVGLGLSQRATQHTLGKWITRACQNSAMKAKISLLMFPQ